MVMLEIDKDLARSAQAGTAQRSVRIRRDAPSGVDQEFSQAYAALVLALRNSTAKVHCKHTSARPTIKFPGSHGMTPQRRAARFLQGRARGLNHD